MALGSRAAEHAGRLHVFGWTARMEYFIRAADIVVGKPGGLTVAEVLACGRPLLAARSLGGQEGFNARFLEQHDVGRLVPEEELPACVDAWQERRAPRAAEGARGPSASATVQRGGRGRPRNATHSTWIPRTASPRDDLAAHDCAELPLARVDRVPPSASAATGRTDAVRGARPLPGPV
jgi:hypothetical protein